MTKYAQLIKALKEIHKGDVKNPGCGICFNLLKKNAEIYPEGIQTSQSYHLPSYALVETYSADWEHAIADKEGKYANPVPHNEDFGNWEGPNLLMRQSLIDHIIKKLEVAE